VALDVGAPAPDFSLRNQHGELVELGGFAGRNLVMVFYPWAFSRVCSGELAEIRDNLADLQSDSSAVVAISCDAMFSLRVFADRDGLTFPLLSDFWPHGAVARRYGVFNEELGSSARATYIVDRDGIVRWQVANAIGEARDLDTYRRALTDLR
jgi:peroxiredoxin